MSSDSKNPPSKTTDLGDGEESAGMVVRGDDALVEATGAVVEGPAGEGDPEAGHVGVERYVHASFFAGGILCAYLMGKILLALWNSLAEWPVAVRSLPFLIEYTEEDRAGYTLFIGAVVGLLLILRYYRRPSVKNWATSVAAELARVTWPGKDTVTNGTIVVLVAGAIATVYIALLDRLWGYLTNLVYGA